VGVDRTGPACRREPATGEHDPEGDGSVSVHDPEGDDPEGDGSVPVQAPACRWSRPKSRRRPPKPRIRTEREPSP